MSQVECGGAPASSVDVARKFDELPLRPEIKKAMSEGFGYSVLTDVQAKTFDPVLQGADVVARAKTGAGKTLSFLVPALERVLGTRAGAKTGKGTVDALVVSPVRELSMQIAQEAEKLLQHCPGARVVCMTGGVPWTEDLEALDAAGEDVVLLVATPGRLQTHLSKTAGFPQRLSQLQVLVLDEVDQLAHEIFRPATEEIIRALPASAERQSLFYSATMSDAVHELVKAGAKPDHIFVDVLQADQSTPTQIDQFYNVVATEDMTRALWKTIQFAKAESAVQKIVVIFMTGRIAAYYAEAFRLSGSDLDVFEIHARLKQNKRTEASDKFRAASTGILFTSDVSSRGLDYPGVTEVIQMGTPHSKDEYIHRLGRTGRAEKQGRGFLLMHEFERSFLARELHDQPIVESSLDFSDVAEMPDFISMKIAKNTKAQAYYSRINHVMRINPEELPVLEIMREAKRFAASVGALDEEGRPPEITQENAVKMGVADIDDPCVYVLPGTGADK